MERILIGIPVLTGAEHCKEAIDRVAYKENVDVLIIDNGAECSVKELILTYVDFPNIHTIRNKENLFVNPAWNQCLDFFLRKNYDRCIVMNSDLIMQEQWSDVCQKRWVTNPDEILLPVMGELHDVNTDIAPAQKVDSGTAGVFITLNRKQAELIYPIPDEIKVWHGDEWIYTILRNKGYETLIPENLLAKHYWSSTVSKVPNIETIIEEDKKQWELIKKKYSLLLG